ncbi:MAG: TonB-dependent receptor [Ferruginibacter sp.]
MKKTVALTVILFLFIEVCCAQYIIKGSVKDEQLRPLGSVSITVGKKLLTTVTDSAGNYSFPFSSANTSLSFSHVGYETVVMSIIGGNVPTIILLRNNLFLSETVVNSFERNSNIKNLPAAVTLLNKSSLERYGNESFVPAINTVPGVKMDERSPGSYRLSIRGNLLRSTFGVRNVKVYWNGIPFTDANGNTYFNELALSNTGRIEILKGPSGSMYGSGTGGVVLLKSDLVSTKEKTVTLQAGAGSYGLFTANTSYSQSDKNASNALSISHQQSDGYRTHTNMRRDVANFTGSYLVNTKQNISANIFYSDLYYQTPGALTQAEVLKDPRQARPAAGAFKSAEAQKAALYLKTWYAGFANEYRFNSNWNNTTALYISNTSFQNPTIRNYEAKTEHGIGMRSVTKYKSKIFTGTFGAEYQYGFTNTSTFGNQLGEADTLQYQDKIDSRQFNIFLQTDLSLLENLILNAGISYNNFHYGFVRVNYDPAIKESSDFTPQLVPRISLLTKIKDRISVYASVSKGYSPPSIDEVHAGDGNFNKQLNAETAMNYEAGIKGDIIKNKLSVDISYYISGLKNTIVSRRDSTGGDYFVNAGKTKQQGFEAAINFMPVKNNNRFIRQFNVWVNYTNIHARFVNYEQGTSKYDGNKLTGTSPNVFVSGIDLNTAIGVYTNLTYNYTDQIPVNDANSFYANAYNLFFARLGYKVKLNKSITADIFIAYNKSFNEPYNLGNDLNAAGNRYYNPSSPQNMSGGIKLKFLLK